MDPQPPTYRSSASVSRTKTTSADLRSQADALLQASLTGKAVSITSSDSSSRWCSNATRSDVTSSADAMLQASLSGRSVSAPSSASVTSSTSTAPPSYRRSPTSVTRRPGGAPALSAISQSLTVRSVTSSSANKHESRTLAELNAAADQAARDRLPSEPQDLHSTGVSSVGLIEKRALASYADRKVSNDIDGSPSRMTAAESKERLRRLQLEVKQANAETPARNTAGVFRKACSTDLLFLVDTTNSMQEYINAARDQIKNIVRDIKQTFLHETEVRIAVVSYQDHLHKDKSIRFLDFTTEPSEVSSFLDSLQTGWGKDFPEDVLGGIRQAVNASWRLQTRCLIHIADAPPHGSILHDGGPSWDDYYEHGSEPHKLTYTPLLRKMVQLRLNYAFLRITPHTDRMLLKFSEIYSAAGADIKLLRSNKYSDEVKKARGNVQTSLWSGSSNKGTAELQFEELPLGTSFTMLQHLVVKTVTRSASLAATRVLSNASRQNTTNTGGGTRGQPLKALSAIRESDDEPEPEPEPIITGLEKISPQWTSPTWFKETLTLEGFCPDMGLHDASTLNEMMANDDNIRLTVTQLTVHKRPKPFAEGGVRLAFYARTAASTDKFVVKSFKISEENAMAQMIEDMRAQALCKAFALEFNSLLREEYAIDFVVTTGWQDKSKRASPNTFISIEPFIDGEYVKYNSNAGYVKEQDDSDPFNDAAQAFSHFTFERSFGYFMVTDLQGVGHSFTDPAIQAKDPERFKLSPTNTGVDGFKFFFATHVCNPVCKKLELVSDKTMFVQDNWRFREEWPTMDNTVCCSNKLCRKIVRVANAHKSSKFPACHWCHTCWPQLESTMVQSHCAEPGPDHVFDISRFFYESQGQPVPHKCPRHLEKDTSGFTAAAAGASLFSRMNSSSQRLSNSGRAW